MRVDRLPNDPKRIRRYFQRLSEAGAPRVCYEASGAGYVLQRALGEWGIPCELAAPSLIPRRPGEQQKTDRRDAIKIARDFRDDRLVLIHIPTEADERVRDLVRCRETFQRELIKSRHYILKFLRRRGFIYREGTHWTTRHMNWIRQVLQPGTLAEDDRTVLAEYLALLEYKLQRRDALDRRIEELALTPRYQPVVDRIACFRGFKTHAAMVLATELGDLRRFENPRQLMAYLGLVPSEHSSGDRRRQGAITKAGNARCRHVLIQAAWCYRRRPTVGASLKRRQEGQDPPSSPTPGNVSIASTRSSTGSRPRSPSRWPPPPSPASSSASSGPRSRTSTSLSSRSATNIRRMRTPLDAPSKRRIHRGRSRHDRRTPENVTGHGFAPDPRV